MTGYYIVEPEVAGQWGESTEFTRAPGQPVLVHKLHYQFDGWLGDELLESTPCYIVTERLAVKIQQLALSGVSFDEVYVSKSPLFYEAYPGRNLPHFLWLKIDGLPGSDDFGVTADLQLVVSARALALLNEVGIPNALVDSFNG